jgi:glutaredoxin 2
MKTELALLMLTDGRPSMKLEELAKLRNIDPRTAMNQIHAKRFPIPVWKDGAGYFAHVGDVAKWLDAQREQATRDSQAVAAASSSATSFSRRRGA